MLKIILGNGPKLCNSNKWKKLKNRQIIDLNININIYTKLILLMFLNIFNRIFQI